MTAARASTAVDATQCPDGAAARLQKYPGILSAAISRRCHRWDGAAEAATGQRRGARPAALPATRPLPRLEALPCSLPRPQAASAQAGRVQALTKRRPTLFFPWTLRTPLDMKHPSSKASLNCGDRIINAVNSLSPSDQGTKLHVVQPVPPEPEVVELEQRTRLRTPDFAQSPAAHRRAAPSPSDGTAPVCP